MESKVTRRIFVLACASLGIAAASFRLFRTRPTPPLALPELEAANRLFFKGDYAAARAGYLSLATSGQSAPDDANHSAALCSYLLGNFDEAGRSLSEIADRSADDWRLAALVEARRGNLSGASGAFLRLPVEDSAVDIELCEEIAAASARAGDRPQAWHFYRLIERADPNAPAIQRLVDSGDFNFTHDFFGHGPSSLLNYGRGVGVGVWDWSSDTASSLWRLVRHPVDSAESAVDAVSQIFTEDNLKLLTSPKALVSKLGAAAGRVYWSAWESCKSSVAREYKLDADSYESQQAIHEMAAGRMVGYAAPDLILLALSGGAGEALDAERGAELITATQRAEEGIEEVNLIGRTPAFLKDAETVPDLRRIAWLDDATWEALKGSSRMAGGRLEQAVGLICGVRNVPGAREIVDCIVSRLHLPDVEGYLFQLERAAEYEREGTLASIGQRFHIDVVLPGKPVRRMLAEADLALTDGTLVETKFRAAPLSLDDGLHTQLLKYDRAVAEGKFSRIRLECNNDISQAVRDRCSVLGSTVEIAQRVPYRLAAP